MSKSVRIITNVNSKILKTVNIVSSGTGVFPTYAQTTSDDRRFPTVQDSGGSVRGLPTIIVPGYGVVIPPATTTWNPLDKDASITLSNGNLTATGTSSGDHFVRGVGSHTSGKYYVEFTAGAVYSGGDTAVGIANASATGAGMGANGANAYLVFASGGSIYFNGASQAISIGAIAPTHVVGMAIDLDNKKAWFRLDSGFWVGNSAISHGDPAAGTNALDISALFGGALAAFPTFVAGSSSGAIVTANFGASAYTFTAPVGFGSWS